MRKVLELRSG